MNDQTDFENFAVYDKNGRTTGSPCVRICKLDPVHKLCVGCFRTVEEIENWINYSNSERKQIMVAIDLRKELICDEIGQS